MKLTKTQEQALVAHSERLEQAEQYENLPASRQDHFVVSEIAQFVEDGKRKPATSTHFEQLDEVLGGGLQGGSLYVLGAISSLGKTTLALTTSSKTKNKKFCFSLWKCLLKNSLPSC